MNGRSSGSGTYSYHQRSSGKSSVSVAHMPEDSLKVRITFRDYDDQKGPIWVLSETEAEMLWASLCSMAQDLKWEDYK